MGAFGFHHTAKMKELTYNKYKNIKFIDKQNYCIIDSNSKYDMV